MIDNKEYNKIYTSALNDLQLKAKGKFEDVYINGWLKGLAYHMRKYGLPKDMEEARNRVQFGVSTSNLYMKGHDIDEVIGGIEGTVYNPLDDYTR